METIKILISFKFGIIIKMKKKDWAANSSLILFRYYSEEKNSVLKKEFDKCQIN